MNKLKLVVFLAVLLAMFSQSGFNSAQALSTDNYKITQYDIEMKLERDNKKRSRLQVVETITAEFPSYDQNHGLERVFVQTYDGHPADITIKSVSDKDGKNLAYHWQGDVLRIGEADKYVHGQQTYKISYTQSDVTKYYKDTNKDEFYWDVLGVDSRVPIESARVRLSFDKNIASAINTKMMCYRGSEGSSSNCTVTQIDSGSFLISETNLTPGEGITAAIGFKPGTFAPYEKTLFEKLFSAWLYVQAALLILATVILASIITLAYRSNNRTREIGTTVPEYLPPKEVSVTAASQLIKSPRSTMTAQLIDLAVHHYIKIIEIKPKRFLRSAEYEIEIMRDIDKLSWEAAELIRDMYDGIPQIGDRLNLNKLKNNYSFTSRLRNNPKTLQGLIRGDYGLKEKNLPLRKTLHSVTVFIAIAGVILLSPVLLGLALVVFITALTSWRLSDKGLALTRYLKGLEMYIKVAEEERIKMLQSPEGAAKVAEVNVGNIQKPSQRLVLYEKVLPYAILFGQEKQWNKQLGDYYEQANKQPDWYSGSSGVFNAAIFTSAMSSLSSSVSASSGSSSSGGSGGGGYSGGGGGGGGAGGW